MSPHDLMSRILSNTFTKNDCFKRLLVLQEFLAHEHFNTAAGAGRLSEQLRGRYADERDRESAERIAEWGDEFLAAVNDPSGAGVDALKKAVAALPELVLYVPTVFDPSQTRAIAEWCRTNIDPTLLLDLRVDQATAGGCILVWKNVLYDFSLGYFLRKHERELSNMIERIIPPNPSPLSA